MTPQAAFEKYHKVLESLTAVTLDSLGDVVAPNIKFVHPFYQTVGIEKMKNVFQRLFDSEKNIEFKIDVSACSKIIVYYL